MLYEQNILLLYYHNKLQERRKGQVETHQVILGRMQRGCSAQWLPTFWRCDPTDGTDGWMEQESSILCLVVKESHQEEMLRVSMDSVEHPQ